MNDRRALCFFSLLVGMNDKADRTGYGGRLAQFRTVGTPAHNKIDPAMQIHPLITDSETLAALCARLAKSDFVWPIPSSCENSYWPDLCLIQIADANEAAAIDPKADIDLKPLLDLLVDNEDVLKVFHAGGRTWKSSST